MTSQIIPIEMRTANQTAFDNIYKTLNGQLNVIVKVKNEINAMRDRFVTMVNLLNASSGDEITASHKVLYDSQITAFLHTMAMYLETRDGTGNYYINPVTEASTTTTMSISVVVPLTEINDEVCVLYNVLSDIDNHKLYIGTTDYTALTSSALETAYAEVPEEGDPIFLKSHFITGVTAEMVKLTKFCMDVCKNEMRIRSGMKYISELRGLGL